jgi:hypothetical protein
MAFIGNPAETLSNPVKFSPQRQGNLHIKNDIDDMLTVCTTEIFIRKFVLGDCFLSAKICRFLNLRIDLGLTKKSCIFFIFKNRIW